MLKKLAGYSPIPLTDDHKVVKSQCACFPLKLKCFFVVGALLLSVILWSWLSYANHSVLPSAWPGTHKVQGGKKHYNGLLVPLEGKETKEDLSTKVNSTKTATLISRENGEHDKINVDEVRKHSLDVLKGDAHNFEKDYDRKNSKVNDNYYDEKDEKVYAEYNAAIKHQGTLKQHLPKCIVIGVSKAGTSALLFFLKNHPKIVVAEKEIHFFDIKSNFNQGTEWYKEQMPLSYADQITIEKTPSYFVSVKVAQRVYSVDRTMKLILIVREPVSRAISQYLLIRRWYDRHHVPYPSFESVVINPVTGYVNTSFKAVRSSVYSELIKHWLAIFPREQIHVVDGDNLRKAPWEEIRKVETFLDLDHLLGKEMFVWNDVKGFYCIQADSGVEECLPDHKGRHHPVVDAQVIRKLKNFYRPFNERFFEIVGQTFNWD